MVTLHHHTHILQTSPPNLQACGIAVEHDTTMSHCWSVALMPVNISLGLHGSVNMEAFDWLAIHHIIWFVTGCHFGASYHCLSLKMTAAVPHSRSVPGSESVWGSCNHWSVLDPKDRRNAVLWRDTMESLMTSWEEMWGNVLQFILI